MKATIQDIAEQLNISTSTVSRSLRQDPTIHPRTRARVAEVAIRLGYEGRTQRGSRSATPKRSLGVLMAASNSATAVIHENAVRMLQGISEECDRLSIPLMLHTITHANAGKLRSQPELVPGSLRDHSAEAMLLIGTHEIDDVRLIAEQVPTVTLSWIFKDVETDAVLLDNIEGIAGQVDTLVRAGHRRLAWVHQRYTASFYYARHCGFIQGCLVNGLELSNQREVTPTGQREPKAFDAIDFRAMVVDGVTAFVCANDSIARLLMLELAEQGIRVPDDVSVTGFDAMSNTDPRDPILNSVNPHFEEVGRDAVRLAMRRIQNPTARPALLTVRSTPVEGQTVKPNSR